MKTSKQLAMLLAAVATTACNTDLKIADLNAPDAARAVSNAGDVQTLIGGGIRLWYIDSNNVDPGMAMSVMADELTSSYGNFGMRFNSNEPRIAYNNSSSAGDGAVANDPWRFNYAILGQADDGLKALARGVKIMDGSTDVSDEYEAIGRFLQGATLSNIALIFDKGFIVDENSPIPAPATFSPYKDVATAALAKLDQAIALSAGKTWQIPDTYFTAINMTAANFNQLLNTMAAQLLAYTPRMQSETDAVDWARVRAYAVKGIDHDFAPIGDYNNWWTDWATYANTPSWTRVDMRVIHEMDPNSPVEFPSCATPPRATSADARLASDFAFQSSIPFSSARGCYHFSSWAYARELPYGYDSDAATQQIGPYPMIRKAENDLLIAEADVRLGSNLAEAATLINNTRVGRGNLTPVSAGAGAPALLAAIQYEQSIELFATGPGLAYYNRRRMNGLQPQTPLHLPVPAKELQTDGLPVYTFGGPNNPDH
ncbi:MAG: RagB/SusD family nutrient uptake outer membrane protein [Gemmatimonadaceae bacterium]